VRKHLIPVLGLGLMLAFNCVAQPADVDGTRIAAANHEPGNWMSHGRTYDEQRFSPLDKVNAGNVNKLGLAWTYKLDIDRGVEATPLVVDGVMYTTGAWSIVYALDARNGKLLWKYDPQVPGATLAEGCCDTVNRGVAVWNGKVYVGSFDGRLIALDARNGRVVWSVDTIIDHKRSYTVTGAPRIIKGKVIIGNGGAEYGVRGYITAYDAETGKQAWRFYTVPGDPAQPPESPAMEIALKTWSGNNWIKWGGGGTVWDSMAYDPELNQLYIGVGNGSPWNYEARSESKGDNLFLSSIVSINPDTGAYNWHYQTSPGDHWDYTATQHIILADLTIEGKPRKVLMQAPKNGFFYVIDRNDGKLISANNYVPVNWATHVDLETGRPVMTDLANYTDANPSLITPGPFGGHNWQPMSFNPQTGLVYIPAQETQYPYIREKAAGVSPNKAIMNPGIVFAEMPADEAAVKAVQANWKGRLLAWNPVTQKAAWSKEYPMPWNGGTLSTAGNLVFQGTTTGHAVAYAADSGKELWSSFVNSGVIAAPITYQLADGTQYVAFMAGWGGSYVLAAGQVSLNADVRPEARVVVFKLGGKGHLPAPKKTPREVPAPPALTASAEQLATGGHLFHLNCANCHGSNVVSGGVIPDLRYLTATKHLQFDGILSGARINRGMPNFALSLKPEEMALIHQYIIKRTLDLRSELTTLSKK
jgi:quinohemoprotein ethanol dehydrogenase